MPHSTQSIGRSTPPSRKRGARKSSRTTRGNGSEGRSERGHRGNEGGMNKPIVVALSAAAVAVVALGLIAAWPEAARAQGIIEEWNSIKAPPPPLDKIKPVQVDPKKTAVLSLD